MAPRTREGEGGCWAIANRDDATTIATAMSGRASVERKILILVFSGRNSLTLDSNASVKFRLKPL
jgi:hypothetical protein